MIRLSEHPKALPFLFLTEMWERFGFYVVQGMLVLYMTQAYGLPDDESYAIVGVFSALAYISPMIGGYIADNLLGIKPTIICGGIFLSAGYALLSLPWENNLYPALATIIAGNGLFKPNISSLLGTLYARDDRGRETGFTIFYIGINLGILLAGVSSGTIKDHFGWHAGFALASAGLLFGLIIFTWGWCRCNLNQNVHQLPATKRMWLRKPFLIFYLFAAIAVLSELLQSTLLSKWLLPGIGLFLLFFIFYLAYKQDVFYRHRLILLNILSMAAIIFWTLYLQLYLSANLFIDRLIDKTIFGITIPTTVFYTLVSVFVIVLGPIFAWSWQTLSHGDRNPSIFSKFITAILFAGLGFAILSVSTYFTNAGGLINPLWIVASYICIAIGELFLSPTGLSAVTLLSPPRLVGLMMGVWFVALGFGGEFGGILAKLASVPKGIIDPGQQAIIYRKAFFEFSCVAFSVSVLLLLLQRIPFLTRFWDAQHEF